MSENSLGYCAWCGATAPQNSATTGDGWRCARCQRLTVPRPPEQMSQVCPACHAAYVTGAHYCPACGTVSIVFPPSSLQTEHGLLPSPQQPIWPTKSWWAEDGRGLNAPPCPACGGKLRPDGAGAHRHPGSAFPPWNADWDGRCAGCGQAVAVSVEQQTHFRTKRRVSIEPAESFHQTFIDEGMVFSGVRIRVEETSYSDKAPQVSEIFLSMGELMSLVRALDGKAKPLLSQFDWTCDWT